MRRRLLISAVAVAAVFSLDSLLADQGPRVGCGDLALGDSLFVLRLKGQLHHAEYYEQYGDAFYIDAECDGERVRYWLSYDWRGVSPRVTAATAIVEMKTDPEAGEAVLHASGFGLSPESLIPAVSEIRDGNAHVVSQGRPINSGPHQAYRSILQDPGGRVLMDNLVVGTRRPS
ncbi:MAG: hypothetical protein AAF845_20225 [Bacteroidota bacterium]